MKSKILMSVLVIVVALSMVVGGTMAWFTDTVTSTQSTFTTGTLNVSVNNDVNGLYSFDLGNISNLAPGESTGEASIYITNNGTIDLAWVGGFQLVGSDAQKELAKYLVIKSMKMEFYGGSWNEAKDQFITNGLGDGLYPTYYNALAASDPLKKLTLATLVKDSTYPMGLPNGYNKGALKPGYAYKLSFVFELDSSAGNNLQGLSMGLKYKVDATQVQEGAIRAMLDGLGFTSSVTELSFFTGTIANQH